MTNMDWIWGGVFLSGIVLIIVIAEVIRKELAQTTEFTRKIVHIITGLFIGVTPFVFKSYYPLITIAVIFILLNYIAIKWKKFKSLHGIDRVSYGTIFYPLSFLILTFLLWYHHQVILITSMLIMALADAFAAIVGKRIKNPIRFIWGDEPKSIQGSLIMFISSMGIAFFFIYFLGFVDSLSLSVGHCFWIAIVTAFMATACESISFKGSDNLTVPLGTAFILHYMITHYPHNWDITIGFGLALIIAFISFCLRFLDGGGAVATFIMGTVIFGTGGWKYAFPILAFFILSSILSKIGKKQKHKLVNTFEKSSQRDVWQVLANGGVAGIIVFLRNYFPYDLWYCMYAGSIASANADTWGTEIGVFSKVKPRNILNLKSVPVGSSGAVSLLGSTGALLGSLIIAVVASIFFKNINFFILITISGFLGSMVDSLIGATIQAQYNCTVCHKITEKTIHCNGQVTNRISGWKWVNNDIVNGICTFSGAFFVWLEMNIFI